MRLERKGAFVGLLIPGVFGLAACGQSGAPVTPVPVPVTQTIDAGTVAGSGAVTSQVRPVSGFSRVSLSGVGDLSITQGATESLSLEAEDNLLPLLETVVSNGLLELRVKANSTLQTTKPIKYTLVVKSLSALSVSGVGNVTVGALDVPTLDVQLGGAGKVKISSLKAQVLKVGSAGVGSLAVTAGAVTSQTVDLDGIGSYNACGLTSDTAKVTVGGTSKAVVNVKNSLVVVGSGVGSVKYLGSPTLEQTSSGLGSVTKIESCPSE
jgi:Putative auto-transporter adhesin, head GIN domain